MQRGQGVLLPVAVLHQDGGCGEAGAAGPAEEAGALRVPLAWRRAESGDPGAAAGEVRRCGGGAGQDRGLLPEPGAGGDPAGFLRCPSGRGAGGGAGRGTEAVNG